MRLFLVFLVFFYSYANDFSNKKIIKLKEENFEFVDLNQEIKTKDINDQEAIFNSASLKQKNTKKIIKEKDKDFAIVSAYNYKKFGFVLDKFKISQDKFSKIILENVVMNLLNDKKILFLNSQANGLYQTQKSVNFLSSSSNYKLFNVSKYLKYEKDREKIYDKKTDYMIFISLNDFYINLTNYMVFKTKVANAFFSYKILDMKNKKEKISKKFHIKLELDNLDNQQAFIYCANEISKKLIKNLKYDIKKIVN